MIESPDRDLVANALPDEPAIAADLVKETVSRNVAVDALSRLGYMISRFFVPPFVLAHVSLEAYGLWTTAFILVSYIGVSTLGISNVYIKFVAEYAARREFGKANSLVSTGLLVTTPASIALFGAIWFAWPTLSHWLHIAPRLEADAREVILSVVAIFLASICLAPFHDILAGVQQNAVVMYIRTLAYVVETVLIYALVGWGRGIRGLAEAYVVRNALEIVLSAPITFRKLPWLRISPNLFSKDALRLLFSFGGIVQIQSLLAIFLDSVERAIAAPLLGLESLALLEISQKLPTMGATVPLAFNSAFMPAASYLQGGIEEREQQEGKIRELYLRGSRYMNLTSGYICAFLVAMPAAVINAWLGKSYPGAAYLMVVFAIATQLHLMTGPGTTILRGIGRVSEEFYYAIPNLLALLITVPASWLVLRSWTTLGIGTAVPLATVLASLYFVRRANRLLHVDTGRYWRFCLWPAIAPYPIAICLAPIVSYLVAHSDRWTAFGWVVAGGLLYTIAFAALVDRFIWRSDERSMARRMLGSKLPMFSRAKAAVPAV
jgi:O-antigen/teichoic acid export membrane protein